MDQNKENWKEQILRSLEGIHRAEVNPFLYAKIVDRLSAPVLIRRVAFPKIALATAGFALLLILNVWVLRSGSEKQTSEETVLINQYNFGLY